MAEGIIEILKPHPSWVWDEVTTSWVAPDNKACPGNGKPHIWDESVQNWVEIEIPPATEIIP
jgi:hypothetical protein